MSSAPEAPPLPPPLPPTDAFKPNLQSALTNAIKLRTADRRGSDAQQTKAIEDKIDAYKKEKEENPTEKDLKNQQHQLLMKEFKLKHKKMFIEEQNDSELNGVDTPQQTRSAEADVAKAPQKPTNIAFQSKILNNKRDSTDGSAKILKVPIKQPKQNVAVLKESEVGLKSKADIPKKVFNIKPAKSAAVIPKKVINVSEEPVQQTEGEDNADAHSVMNFWKNKVPTRPKSTYGSSINLSQKKVEVPIGLKKATSASDISAIPEETTQTLVDRSENVSTTVLNCGGNEENSEDIDEDHKSASDLIKSFNVSSKGSSKQKKMILRRSLPNQPTTQPGKTTQPMPKMVSIPSTKTPSKLVKQQVSVEDLIVPPPPADFTCDSSSNDFSSTNDFSSPGVVIISSKSNSVSISVNSRSDLNSTHSNSDLSNFTYTNLNDTGPPIRFDSSDGDYNTTILDNLSANDLLMPPPSSSQEFIEIPKGVPPPPEEDSWEERHNKSVVNIFQEQEPELPDEDFRQRFQKFEKPAASKQAAGGPLVSVSSYTSKEASVGRLRQRYQPQNLSNMEEE